MLPGSNWRDQRFVAVVGSVVGLSVGRSLSFTYLLWLASWAGCEQGFSCCGWSRTWLAAQDLQAVGATKDLRASSLTVRGTCCRS